MIQRYYLRLINHPKLLAIVEWSKKYTLPGFNGVSINSIGRFLWIQYSRDRMVTRANSIAFNLMLAIFPAFIFLLTLLPYIPGADDYTMVMMDALSNIMPGPAHTYLKEVVVGLTKLRSQSLLSIGFVLAMIFSSNGMLSLMTAFDKKDRAFFKRRSVIKERLIAILLTLVIGVLFIGSLLIVVLSNRVYHWLELNKYFSLVDNVVYALAKWGLTVVFIYIGVTIIYRYAPKLRKRIPMINPGSIVATIFSVLTSIAFSYFINKFGRYNEVYGSFGALIVIMIWLQINAFIILAGFELNASIALNVPLDNSQESQNSSIL